MKPVQAKYKRLNAFLANQRQYYRRMKLAEAAGRGVLVTPLTPARIELLELTVGEDWVDVLPHEIFPKRIQELGAFQKQYGHTCVQPVVTSRAKQGKGDANGNGNATQVSSVYADDKNDYGELDKWVRIMRRNFGLWEQQLRKEREAPNNNTEAGAGAAAAPVADTETTAVVEDNDNNEEEEEIEKDAPATKKRERRKYHLFPKSYYTQDMHEQLKSLDCLYLSHLKHLFDKPEHKQPMNGVKYHSRNSVFGHLCTLHWFSNLEAVRVHRHQHPNDFIIQYDRNCEHPNMTSVEAWVKKQRSAYRTFLREQPLGLEATPQEEERANANEGGESSKMSESYRVFLRLEKEKEDEERRQQQEKLLVAATGTGAPSKPLPEEEKTKLGQLFKFLSEEPFLVELDQKKVEEARAKLRTDYYEGKQKEIDERKEKETPLYKLELAKESENTAKNKVAEAKEKLIQAHMLVKAAEAALKLVQKKVAAANEEAGKDPTGTLVDVRERGGNKSSGRAKIPKLTHQTLNNGWELKCYDVEYIISGEKERFVDGLFVTLVEKVPEVATDAATAKSPTLEKRRKIQPKLDTKAILTTRMRSRKKRQSPIEDSATEDTAPQPTQTTQAILKPRKRPRKKKCKSPSKESETEDTSRFWDCAAPEPEPKLISDFAHH